MKRGKIILSVALALVVGLGIGGFIGQSLAVQLAGEDSLPITSTKAGENQWTTYTNQKYGFAVDYPSDWSMIDSTGRFCLIVAFTAPEQGQGAVMMQVIELIDPEEFYTPIVTKDYTMQALTSKQVTYIKNKICYSIACLAPTNNFKTADESYFKWMIASFKFTTS